jgi:hypothetical protein
MTDRPRSDTGLTTHAERNQQAWELIPGAALIRRRGAR